MKLVPPAKSDRLLLRLAGIIVCVLFTACQSAPPARTPDEMPTDSFIKVTLAPGDVVEIKFFYAPELNENQTIRPDGKITLQLVGDVAAQGKTPEELHDELVRLYTPQLKRPEVAVIVRSLASHRVYVGGQVNEPKLIELKEPLTALEAIMQAGGFHMETAQVKNVVVIRNKNGQHYGCALDFSGALKGQEVAAFYLEPRDIVYVPQTTITNVDQWVDQYIRKVLPIQPTLSIFVP
jgi:protein involved in polysaccharide export with SLBB domain